MKIAITTPQGNVGQHLTRMLIRAGVRPLLLSRHPENVSTAVAEHVDLVKADSRDPDQVVSATAGVDAIYWVDPSTDSPDPLGDYRRVAESIVASVEANRIGRVVFQGASARKSVMARARSTASLRQRSPSTLVMWMSPTCGAVSSSRICCWTWHRSSPGGSRPCCHSTHR